MAVVKKVRPSDGGKPASKKKTAPGITPFELATERTQPSDVLQDYSMLLFGAKKIGKSSLASMFDDAYVLATEPGIKALSVYASEIPNWRVMRDAVKALRKDRRFRTTVVDTVDLAYKFCDEYVCDQLGIENVADADWGKGWGEVRKEFEKVMRDIMSAPGKGTLLISHATEKEIKRRDGSKFDRTQPTMATIARDICEAMVDIWAHYDYEDGRRVLTIRGDEHLTAGHRLQDRFMWKGQEVVQIDMGSSKEEGYRNFLDAFHNRYDPTAKAKDVTIVAPAKVVKKVKR